MAYDTLSSFHCQIFGQFTVILSLSFNAITLILEAADELPLEDQENLISILINRLRDRRRAERVRDVKEAQQE
ncbi:MAG: hypothetical protein F6J98_33005, partial [Moorea sp. SIO4G2]|nr:hypothetical protein [Moorena sp. SIO4G2]